MQRAPKARQCPCGIGALLHSGLLSFFHSVASSSEADAALAFGESDAAFGESDAAFSESDAAFSESDAEADVAPLRYSSLSTFNTSHLVYHVGHWPMHTSDVEFGRRLSEPKRRADLRSHRPPHKALWSRGQGRIAGATNPFDGAIRVDVTLGISLRILQRCAGQPPPRGDAQGSAAPFSRGCVRPPYAVICTLSKRYSLSATISFWNTFWHHPTTASSAAFDALAQVRTNATGSQAPFMSSSTRWHLGSVASSAATCITRGNNCRTGTGTITGHQTAMSHGRTPSGLRLGAY